jgi:hypothetical protein
LKAGGEPAHGLRRQRDLGHQHDRAAALLDRLADAAEVDLGLAAAGDAHEQVDGEPAAGDARAQAVEDLLLVLVERQLGLPGGAGDDPSPSGWAGRPAA